MSHEAHWQRVYSEKGEDQVSWFQETPETSLALVEAALAGSGPSARVLDVGGGASRLVDHLLTRGGAKATALDITVLDIAAAALEQSRRRLGERAGEVRWVVGDVTAPLAFEGGAPFDVWHDRAVFHFLTTAEARAAWRANVEAWLKPGGQLVVGTFALDGPERCSGLPVQRWSAPLLAAELGAGFALEEAREETHQTPWGSGQRFMFSRFRRIS